MLFCLIATLYKYQVNNVGSLYEATIYKDILPMSRVTIKPGEMSEEGTDFCNKVGFRCEIKRFCLDGSVIKSTGYCLRGSKFNSQQPQVVHNL